MLFRPLLLFVSAKLKQKWFILAGKQDQYAEMYLSNEPYMNFFGLKYIINKVIDWLVDWLIDWLIDWLL